MSIIPMEVRVGPWIPVAEVTGDYEPPDVGAGN